MAAVVAVPWLHRRSSKFTIGGLEHSPHRHLLFLFLLYPWAFKHRFSEASSYSTSGQECAKFGHQQQSATVQPVVGSLTVPSDMAEVRITMGPCECTTVPDDPGTV